MRNKGQLLQPHAVIVSLLRQGLFTCELLIGGEAERGAFPSFCACSHRRVRSAGETLGAARLEQLH